MGYMGFGMKKENYTRRPRKAFERYKEINDHHTIRSGSRISNAEFHISGSSWIDHREKRWLKITKAGFVLTIFMAIAYVLAIDPFIKRLKRERFESTYFEGLYRTGKDDLQKLSTLHHKVPGLHKMSLTFYGQLFVVVKSPDFIYKHDLQGGDNVVNLAGLRRTEYQQLSVDDGVLFVDRPGKRYYVLDHWAIIYDRDITYDQNLDLILPVLKLSRSDFDEFICDLQDISLSQFEIDDKKRLHFFLNLYDYGTYEIVVQEKPFSPGKAWKKLDENVFWRRNYSR